jgi:hypothetical protein
MIQVEATCVNDGNNKLHAVGVSAMRNMKLARVSILTIMGVQFIWVVDQVVI